MGADQAAQTLLSIHQHQAESSGKKLSPKQLDALRDRITADYQRQTDIRYAAARLWIDAIVAPSATRDTLLAALRLATRPPPPGGFRAGFFRYDAMGHVVPSASYSYLAAGACPARLATWCQKQVSRHAGQAPSLNGAITRAGAE